MDFVDFDGRQACRGGLRTRQCIEYRKRVYRKQYCVKLIDEGWAIPSYCITYLKETRITRTARGCLVDAGVALAGTIVAGFLTGPAAAGIITGTWGGAGQDCAKRILGG